MAELAGSPFRGASVAKHFVTLTPTNFRSGWATFEVSTAEPTGNKATWAGAPGTSLTIRFRWTEGGTPAGSAPNFANVTVRLPGDSSNIGGTWAVTFPAVNTDATTTFHFDDNPFNAVLGTASAGMLEVFLDWGNSGGLAPWNATSRGGGTPAALNSIDNARGYVRAPVTLSAFSISNASLGGAEPGQFAFPDSVFQRATLDAVWYRSLALANELRQGGTAKRSNAGTADTIVTRDYTNSGTSAATGRVNNGFIVAATATDVRLTVPANSFGGSADREYEWATSGHVSGFSVSGANLTDDARVTIDPRLTFTQIMQDNNSTFQNPPTLLNTATRAVTDLGFLAARATNARAEGQNALTWTQKLWDNGTLVGSEAAPVATRADTSQTQSGQLGWSDGFMTWDEALPGGGWTHKAVLTTGDATGLELSNTRTLTLVSAGGGFPDVEFIIRALPNDFIRDLIVSRRIVQPDGTLGEPICLPAFDDCCEPAGSGSGSGSGSGVAGGCCANQPTSVPASVTGPWGANCAIITRGVTIRQSTGSDGYFGTREVGGVNYSIALTCLDNIWRVYGYIAGKTTPDVVFDEIIVAGPDGTTLKKTFTVDAGSCGNVAEVTVEIGHPCPTGGGGGGGGTIGTDCCPTTLLPTTLYVIFGGALASLGTKTVTWDAGPAQWRSAPFAACGAGSESRVHLSCSGTTWTVSYSTVFTGQSATITSCSPLTVDISGTAAGTCPGAATANVRETP